MWFLPAAVRHRLPVSIRHHWRLIVVAVVLTAVTIGVLGAYRVRPIALAAGTDTGEESVHNVPGRVDLFDTSVPHSLTLTFSDDAYQRMVATFQDTDEKEYIEADLVIDGVTLENVGIRLKGNSTLRTLGGGPGGDGFPGGGFGGGRGPTAPEGQDGEVGGFGPGFGGTTLSFDAPEELPWLISFDHFVDGRRYQGRENIALRPAGQGGSTLNEAVATTLVGLSGEPTQRWNYSSVTVNDRPKTTRLLLEVPDKPYADDLGDGVLYKALSTSSFTYQGEDPTAYADDFDQINRKGSQDLQPVIDLLRWLDEASDEEFAAELADHVDVESFSRYVSLQNLLLNFDDMAGPGRNFYLYYDLVRKVFSVVTWDLNLALSGDANRGPFDAGSMGGRPGGQFPGDGQQFPALPDGAFQPGQFPPPGDQTTAPPGGGFGAGNQLKERFLAADAFRSTYLDSYRELYGLIYADGAALAALDTAVHTAEAAGAPVNESQVATLRSMITNRTTALAANADLTG